MVSVLGLQTLHLGPRTVLVAARVQFRDDLCAWDIAQAVPRIEERALRVLRGATSRRLVFIEPTLPGTDDAERAT